MNTCVLYTYKLYTYVMCIVYIYIVYSIHIRCLLQSVDTGTGFAYVCALYTRT